MILVDVLLAAAAAPVLAWSAYLGGLALLSWRNPVPASAPTERIKFDVIVPAHDEELGIAATVESLLALDYPAQLRRVVVVADNCRDATAERARGAGAQVLERADDVRRGKGYALEHAFECSLRDGFADAAVCVDADTVVTPNLLRAFAARLERGASAAQAYYAVANPEASWRTRLMRVAFTLYHDVRSRGRERLGVSTGLRGNGMAFSIALLRQIPHDAYSIVEDVEYGVRIGLEGHRVEYVGEARVLGQMVAAEKGSRTQRRRWEGGRLALARKRAGQLLARGLKKRSLLLLDLAADLLVPPLTYVVFAATLGCAMAGGWVASGHGARWVLAPWAAAMVGLAIYIVRGAWLAGVGPRVILDLVWAPVYMVWKVALAAGDSSSKEKPWIRTARNGEKP